MTLAPQEPTLSARQRLTTVMSADICGYSRLAEVDDAAAVKTVEIVFAIFEKAVADHHGRVFNRAGDGFMAEFPSVANGVAAAQHFIAEMRARDTVSPTNPNAKARVGLHVGDVSEQPNGDLLGHGVNIAARLQQEAPPNGIVVSLHAVNLVRDKLDVGFSRRGPLALKNIDQPVVAFDLEDVGRRNFLFSINSFFQKKIFSALHKYANLLLAIVLGISAYTIYASINQQSADRYAVAAEKIDAMIDSLQTRKYNNENISNIDVKYLRRIFRSMVVTNEKSDRLIFALVENGDTYAAIQELKGRLKERSITPKDRHLLYHQIGALSYETHIGEAIAAYKGALDIIPEDFEAASRLGRLYVLQNKIKEAQHYFSIAENIPNNDEEAVLNLKTNIAFNHILARDLKVAREILRMVIKRAEEIGLTEIYSRASTSLGTAFFYDEKYAEAEAIFVSIMPLQQANGYAAEQSRALATMSRIAYLREDHDAAQRYAERSHKIETDLGRAHGIAGALTLIGDAELKLGKYADAEADFLESLRVSREHDLINHQFMSLVGLAETANANANNSTACKYISDAEIIYVDRFQSKMGPVYRKKIADTGCPFSF